MSPVSFRPVKAWSSPTGLPSAGAHSKDAAQATMVGEGTQRVPGALPFCLCGTLASCRLSALENGQAQGPVPTECAPDMVGSGFRLANLVIRICPSITLSPYQESTFTMS